MTSTASCYLSKPDYGKKCYVMAIDQGPVVQSALLRGELVRLRKDRGFTQEQVAAGLDWSHAKLMRLENGRSMTLPQRPPASGFRGLIKRPAKKAGGMATGRRWPRHTSST